MATKSAKKVILLSGGNPQIPKGDGDGPVEDYLAAMPGWKQRVGRELDALVVRALPKVQKAIKWNSPFYGVVNPVWFMNFHCFDRYIKVTFFDGALLDPPPPETSKYPAIRYFHVHEDDVIDENLFIKWVKQASKLPGWEK